jgi:gas vesicle protein
MLGAGLGLLFAPCSGAQTRRNLARQAKRAQIQATRMGRRIKQGIDSTVECGKALVNRQQNGHAVEAA